MKHFIWCLLFCSTLCFGQISPAYYGPNAFPVPDMLCGYIPSNLSVKTSYEFSLGNYGDETHTILTKVDIPLSKYSSFTVFYNTVEFFHVTDKWITYSESEYYIHGHEFGDIYLSTQFQLFNEKDNGFNLTARGTLKTASGESESKKRFYDVPGYYFDSSIGKNFKEYSVVCNLGFLCWQTGEHQQNDAFLYGIMLKDETPDYLLSFSVEGYIGWQNNGDKPCVLKSYIEGKNKTINPFIRWCLGVKDFPFQQVQVGLKFNL